ncbi:hypothetical protein C8E95_7070 [Pseudonocardia autotrophica]|uniref:Uncharacterized protein n=1 Tax=Pseudonocardia autotrophica TaxID=2074 RepID=A0A1Y2MIM9_PSEAH|nr:hypothetical protein BG845_06737 [Pseudonocardia autotrophica]TDN65570.1 hypothetical protein C8E95_7070 [Pseudonocardia autotrophica]
MIRDDVVLDMRRVCRARAWGGAWHAMPFGLGGLVPHRIGIPVQMSPDVMSCEPASSAGHGRGSIESGARAGSVPIDAEHGDWCQHRRRRHRVRCRGGQDRLLDLVRPEARGEESGAAVTWGIDPADRGVDSSVSSCRGVMAGTVGGAQTSHGRRTWRIPVCRNTGVALSVERRVGQASGTSPGLLDQRRDGGDARNRLLRSDGVAGQNGSERGVHEHGDQQEDERGCGAMHRGTHRRRPSLSTWARSGLADSNHSIATPPRRRTDDAVSLAGQVASPGRTHWVNAFQWPRQPVPRRRDHAQPRRSSRAPVSDRISGQGDP